jgi:hypothetical protein
MQIAQIGQPLLQVLVLAFQLKVVFEQFSPSLLLLFLIEKQLLSLGVDLLLKLSVLGL